MYTGGGWVGISLFCKNRQEPQSGIGVGAAGSCWLLSPALRTTWGGCFKRLLVAIPGLVDLFNSTLPLLRLLSSSFFWFSGAVS